MTVFIHRKYGIILLINKAAIAHFTSNTGTYYWVKLAKKQHTIIHVVTKMTIWSRHWQDTLLKQWRCIFVIYFPHTCTLPIRVVQKYRNRSQFKRVEYRLHFVHLVAIWNSTFSYTSVYPIYTHSTLTLFNRYLFIC